MGTGTGSGTKSLRVQRAKRELFVNKSIAVVKDDNRSSKYG